MQLIWRVPPADSARARQLSRAAGVHPITAQLLLNRGVQTAEEASRFLDPRLDTLEDPIALPDMEVGVARLRRAIAKREPILIFGDSDVDGLTASVILYEVLRDLGAVVRAKLSNRMTDGYGLPDVLVRQICHSSTRLVILVDCGTNQAEAVRALATCGVDTIIVDHHVPLDRVAQPHALINPHCAHATRWRELSSAGLTFKVAQALLSVGSNERLAGWLNLAALGALA